MLKEKYWLAFLLAGAVNLPLAAQNKDKGVFMENKGGYYQNTILRDINAYDDTQDQKEATPKRYKVDLSQAQLPTEPDKYKQVWHSKPVSQGRTGSCWCFSTTSFFESEAKRLSGKEVRISEMFTVYYEYVERAEYFVKTRGKMHLGEGSETNAVYKLYKKYGAVPWEAYNGLKNGQKFHNHEQMFVEIEKYLASVKERNAWSQTEVVSTVRSILDFYMGAPPTSVKVNGKDLTPKQYLEQELKLKPDDYVDVMSLLEVPYYKQGEYKVPDNWWRDATYYNVPLDAFMTAVKNAIVAGYSISIGGDTSESGFETSKQVAMVPTYDIPSEYIDEHARQFRFLNGTTTDDHAMHLVGYQEFNGKTWYLVKDSGAGSRNCGETCKQFGYYFIHEDYVKLKMMTFTVHRDAVKDLLKSFTAQP